MDLPKNLKTETKMLSEDSVRQLAHDNERHVEAYEWGYDSVERVLSMQEVLELIKRARQRSIPLQRKHTDEEIRKLICENDAELAYFRDRSHPKIFKSVTDRNVPQRVLRNLMLMIQTKDMINTGKISEDDGVASVQKHIFEECMPSVAAAAAASSKK